MSTKSNENVRGREAGDKPRMSLASRITSSYNRMFILCISTGLFIMLAVTAFSIIRPYAEG